MRGTLTFEEQRVEKIGFEDQGTNVSAATILICVNFNGMEKEYR